MSAKRYVCTCGKLSEQRQCPQCRREREAKRDRGNTTERGYGHTWRKFRQEFLKARPWCEWPGGCGEKATDVHHLDGQGPKGPRGFDPANLQPLCHSHHSQITARERPAGFVKRGAIAVPRRRPPRIA